MACLFTLLYSQYSTAQVVPYDVEVDQQYVSSICYTESIETRIKVVSDLDIENLDFMDHLKFVEQFINIEHSEYIYLNLDMLHTMQE